jgi:hypothetical protein
MKKVTLCSVKISGKKYLGEDRRTELVQYNDLSHAARQKAGIFSES